MAPPVKPRQPPTGPFLPSDRIRRPRAAYHVDATATDLGEAPDGSISHPFASLGAALALAMADALAHAIDPVLYIAPGDYSGAPLAVSVPAGVTLTLLGQSGSNVTTTFLPALAITFDDGGAVYLEGVQVLGNVEATALDSVAYLCVCASQVNGRVRCYGTGGYGVDVTIEGQSSPVATGRLTSTVIADGVVGARNLGAAQCVLQNTVSVQATATLTGVLLTSEIALVATHLRLVDCSAEPAGATPYLSASQSTWIDAMSETRLFGAGVQNGSPPAGRKLLAVDGRMPAIVMGDVDLSVSPGQADPGRVIIPAGVLTAGRSITATTTGLLDGQLLAVERYDLSAHAVGVAGVHTLAGGTAYARRSVLAWNAGNSAWELASVQRMS